VTNVTAFRALLISQWILPFISVAVELWFAPTTDESLAVEVPLLEHTWIDASWFAWMSIPVVVAAIAATIGLYRFRPWGPRTYGFALAAYGAFVAASDTATLTGMSQLLFLLDGALCGAVATWLLVARDRLPYPRDVAV
jgi:hypothetical protein